MLSYAPERSAYTAIAYFRAFVRTPDTTGVQNLVVLYQR